MNISLKDSELARSLMFTFQDIKEQLLIGEQQIIEELEPIYDKLDSEDKNVFLEYLKANFSDYSFVKHVKFNQNDDYKKQLQKFKENKDWNSLIQSLQNEKFCQENQIPTIWRDTRSILLFTTNHKLLEQLIELEKINQDLEYNYLQILCFLLELYHETQSKNQNNIDRLITYQLIGSMLKKQINQFIDYHLYLKQKCNLKYQDNQILIQRIQLKEIDDLKTNLLIEPEFNIVLSLQTKFYPTFDIQNYLQSMSKNDGHHFSIYELIEQNFDIEECYFTLAFYFLFQYCEQFNLSKEWRDLDDNLQKHKEKDHDTKMRMIARVSKKNKDEIYLFFVNYIVYFLDASTNNQKSETYFQQEINPISELLSKHLQKQDLKQEIQICAKIPLYRLRECLDQQKTKISRILLEIQLCHRIGVENVQNLIYESSEKDFFQVCEKIENQYQDKITIRGLCLLITLIRGFKFTHYISLVQLFSYEETFKKGKQFILLENLIEQYLNQENKFSILHELSTNVFEWKLIKTVKKEKQFEQIFEMVLVLYQEHGIDARQQKYFELLQIINENLGTLKDDNKLHNYQLILNFCDQSNFDFIISFKQFTYITILNFKKMIQLIFQIATKCLDAQLENVITIFAKYCNDDLAFQFQKMGELLQKQQEFEVFQCIHLIYFCKYKGLYQELLVACEDLFYRYPSIYKETFKPDKYFREIQFHPLFIVNKKVQNQFCHTHSILLEDFNISMTEISDKLLIIQRWVEDMANFQKFQELIPFFFNIIKKKQSYTEFLSIINQHKKNLQGQSIGQNIKAMFQILYNNSVNELQFILLKLWSQVKPVPLVYLNPRIDKIKSKDDIYAFNSQLFYIFPSCFPIINFTLSKVQKSYGKTHLINELFYMQEVFEVNDKSEINRNTIDIMFDFVFKCTRRFAIADVHGQIPLKTLIKVLPLFKFWIIQMNTEEELALNYKRLNKIQNKLGVEDLTQKVVFIVRNTQQINQQTISKSKENEQLTNYDCKEPYTIIKIMDLANHDLDKSERTLEIEKLSDIIFQKIGNQFNSNNLCDSKQFLFHIKAILGEKNQITQQMFSESQVLMEIDAEIQSVMKEKEGFYSQRAFPMRNLEKEIKLQKEHINQLYKESADQKILEIEKEKLKSQEKLIGQVEPSKLLRLFQKIFANKNYYILYVLLSENIRILTEIQISQLQHKNQEINKKITEAKGKKKQNNKNEDQELLQQNINDIDQEIFSLKCQQKQIQDELSFKQLSIELFWREIIQISQISNGSKLQIDPTQILFQLVKKGEPFEFLDGDSLKIDQKFVENFFKKFQQPEKEKALILSVLGPQSSGKSTMLNMIFGCQFLTSVGRCTKGIYLQVLKVNQKQQFNNLFDYLIIFDTEGLQSPNKNDSEFDKKIALFVLAISDIILITVKGEIHSQFKNLVEMCLYTLGEMKSSIQLVKQLGWCFTQNQDCSNVKPFQDQIYEIVERLNKQDIEQKGFYHENEGNNDDNHKIDYASLLDIKDENIKVLGNASTEKSWSKTLNNKVFKDWKMQTFTDTFSQDAYAFGISMISQFVLKFKAEDENNDLYSLSQVMQNICSNWQSICKLPDLLEFTELKQQEEDRMMKKQFKNLFELKIHSEFQQKIQLQIETEYKQQNQKSINFFLEIEKRNKEKLCNQMKLIQVEISEQLLKFKIDHKIKKKIYLKYSDILEKQLNSFQRQCALKILEQIQNYQRNYYKIKGFKQLEEEQIKIYENKEELKQIQHNKEKIQEKFQNIWNKILKDIEDNFNKEFEEYCESQYQTISSQFTQYFVQSDNQQEYIKQFQKFIKSKPVQAIEEKRFFEIFEKELNSQQIMAVKKDLKIFSYYQIFHQPISERAQKAKKSPIIIDINDYLQYEFQIWIIFEEDLQTYINGKDFEKDFLNFQQKYKGYNCAQFFSPLIQYCSISYDKDKFQRFIEHGEDFKGLQKTLRLNLQASRVIENANFSQNLYAYYPTLKIQDSKCIVKNYSEFEQKIQQMKATSNKQFKFISKVHQVPIIKKEWFQYICNQKEQSQYKQCFEANIINEFNHLLKSQNGWQKVYAKIYNTIKNQMSEKKNYLNISVDGNQSEDERIVKQNNQKIQNILQEIEENIKEMNQEFSKFGIIYKDLGERYIYYYSIFIIWRFTCYSEWNELSKNIQEFKGMEAFQLEKFEADINDDKGEISKNTAKILFSHLKDSFLQNFYKEAQEEIINLIQKESQTSEQVIAQLDQQYLIEINEKSFSQSINYIQNQKQFIKNHAQQQLFLLKTQIIENFQIKLERQLKEIFGKVQNNIQKIRKFTLGQQLIKAEEYFQYFEDKQFKYEQELYSIVVKFIYGLKQDINSEKIKDEFKELFDDEQLNSVGLQPPINQYKIPFLKQFIDELHSEIGSLLFKNNLKFELGKALVDDSFDKLMSQLIGCRECCPMCYRKCDEDHQISENEKHQCRNGHFIRGMNGALIGNRPSLYMCEEIDDATIIINSDSSEQIQWKDIQKQFSKWNFKTILNDDFEQTKSKMMESWNNGLGSLICEDLKKTTNNPDIIFERKHYIQDVIQQPFHYVFVLDTSLSMIGEKFKTAKKCIIDLINDLKKNETAKMTIITFAWTVNKLVNCQKLDDVLASKRFDETHYGYGFCDKIVFQEMFEIFQQNKNDFVQTLFLFYSDGEITYPGHIKEFFNISDTDKLSLQFFLTTGNQSSTLKKIYEELQNHGISVKLNQQTEANQLKKIWAENIKVTKSQNLKA